MLNYLLGLVHAVTVVCKAQTQTEGLVRGELVVVELFEERLEETALHFD